jgi:hypothetical protein
MKTIESNNNTKPTTSHGGTQQQDRTPHGRFELPKGDDATTKDSCSPKPAPAADNKKRDPFDPASLRLSQDFASSLGVKKVLMTVPVRKPSREWFVRVHPDADYRLQTAVIELKEDREIYLVEPSLWPELSTVEATFSPRALNTAINRQGVVILWPIRLPEPDGKIDEWSQSALEAAEMATTKWVRVTANMDLGAYDVYEATGDLPDPVWPDLTFQELLKLGFKDRYIDDMDHAVLRKLRGEA